MSTVVSSAQLSGASPVSVGGLGTGVLIFPSLLGTSFNNGNSQTTSNGPAQVIARAPQSEGQQFEIKGSGNIFVHGTSPTVVISLYKGKSLTAASDTLIATCSAQAVATATTVPYAFAIKGQGDANSGLIQFGSATLLLNGAAVTFTVQGSGIPLTAQDLLTTDVPFCTSVQFGVTDALNKAYLQQFQLEQ